ncbi:T9SS type A sorting domain-containing protein [bacterium]|nr:T9SS type A sorting domain-containing protein [bacterium]MDB4089253.1 T9SS type A sorting domain-containing protein [Flavobacteriales bacterium]
MIKKLLSIAAIACFSNSMAQNIELRIHNGTALINGTTITLTDTLENDNNQDVAAEIDMTSKFTSSTDVKVKRYEITTTAPLSENAICWGVCTPNILWGAKALDTTDHIPMVLNDKVTFSGHVYPRLHSGITTFKYVWYDVSNPNDSAWVNVNFDVQNPNAVGIEEVQKETSIKIFPNPATDFVNVAIASNEVNKKIEIIDLLGKVVYSNSVAEDNTKLRVNTSNFLPGVYFVSITSNNKSIRTSKIVIAK